MTKRILLSAAGILVLAASIPAILPGSLSAALSHQVVKYDIKARLVPESKTIEGHEVLTWTNDSTVAVSELRFHLYMNAFKNNRTTFMTESGGAHRGFRMDEQNWGSVTVKKIALQDGPDLTASMTYVQPDDGDPDDQTVMSVALPGPVKPQARITLVIDFVTKLPKVFARSGFVGDFFMVGQWFPKIGVLWNGAWNCHQYHSHSEFFADYGAFRVEITAPERYVVGATGKRTSETKNADGTKTYIHEQEDVHDFAWTACPEFVEFHEKFTLADPPVATEMILLVHRAHLGSKARYETALRHALEFYSQNYGAYPYATVTLVDPAPGAMAAGGMEYPTLFTADTTSYMPAGFRMPEMVTIHEFGHGYWYGIVGSNEFEEAWLDEGINSYSESKAMDKYYGADGSMISLGMLKIGEIPYQRLSVIGSGRFDPIDRISWDFVGAASYSLNVYNKAALMMLTLERMVGPEVMSRIMKTYYERWKFRHPTTEDFVAAAEEASGQDLHGFFDQALHSPDKLDYGISSLDAFEIAAPEGIFDAKPEGESAAQGTTAASVEKKSPPKKKGEIPPVYRNEVVVARFGEWIFRQEIVVSFADGTTARETWDGKERWKRFVYVKPVKVASAEVDPEHKLLLDVNFTNNGMVLEPKRGPVLKFALGFTEFFQSVLSFISL